MPTQVNLGHVVGPTGPTGPTGPAPIKGTDYWTEEEQSVIVEEAAQEAAALVNVNVPKKTVSDLVAHAEDAFPQKPIETRIKGKTWVNRWPVFNIVKDGVTIETDGTGLITVSRSDVAESIIYVTIDNAVLSPGTGRSICCARSVVDNNVKPFVNTHLSNTTLIAFGNSSDNSQSATITNNDANLRCGIQVNPEFSGTISFRVMLVDGTEAPDCFTPCASIASVQPGNLVTSGKNLIIPDEFETRTSNGITVTKLDDGGYSISGTASSDAYIGVNYSASEGTYGQSFPPNVMVTASMNDVSGVIFTGGFREDYNGQSIPGATFVADQTVTSPKNTKFMYCYLLIYNGTTLNNAIVYPQLELGSTATAYEPPNITKVALPKMDAPLMSVKNRADELVIEEDGSVKVERVVSTYVVKGTEPVSFNPSIHMPQFKASGIGVNRYSPDAIICDKLPIGVVTSNATGCALGNNGMIYFNVAGVTVDADTGKAWLYENRPTFWLVNTDNFTTDQLGPVTLPALPAPTFNQYHDSDVPSDTSTEYVRDINIVLVNLEAVQAALLGGE